MDNNESPLSPKDMDLFVAGIQIAVCFLLCAGIGYYIDLKCHTLYRWTTRGVWVGLVCGLGNFIKTLVGALHDKR